MTCLSLARMRRVRRCRGRDIGGGRARSRCLYGICHARGWRNDPHVTGGDAESTLRTPPDVATISRSPIDSTSADRHSMLRTGGNRVTVGARYNRAKFEPSDIATTSSSSSGGLDARHSLAPRTGDSAPLYDTVAPSQKQLESTASRPIAVVTRSATARLVWGFRRCSRASNRLSRIRSELTAQSRSFLLSRSDEPICLCDSCVNQKAGSAAMLHNEAWRSRLSTQISLRRENTMWAKNTFTFNRGENDLKGAKWAQRKRTRTANKAGNCEGEACGVVEDDGCGVEDAQSED